MSIFGVMYGRTYTRRRRARDVRWTAERAERARGEPSSSGQLGKLGLLSVLVPRVTEGFPPVGLWAAGHIYAITRLSKGKQDCYP